MVENIYRLRFKKYRVLATFFLIITFLSLFKLNLSKQENSVHMYVATSNSKPNVIPSLREWTSGTGYFTLTANSRICIDPNFQQLADVANTLSSDMKYINNFSPPIVFTSSPTTGAIYLTMNSTDTTIGNEGYLFNVGNYITINAKTKTGVFYGTRTLLQLLKQSLQIVQGNARDYPNYSLRGFMFDASTQKFDRGTLEDYIKYMAWYKLNDFHIHLNDNQVHPSKSQWQTAYANFRLQNTSYSGLAEDSTDSIYYTEQDFRTLQDLAKQYFVNIIPEIDSPAHALSIVKYAVNHGINIQDPNYMDELNLANPTTFSFMDGLWNSYLPMIDASNVSIGGDEYSGDNNNYKSYINNLNSVVKATGKTARMWGEWATSGGATGVDKDIILNIWNAAYYTAQQAISDGFSRIINSEGELLYIVPLATYYPDWMDTQWMYNNWEPNVFSQDHSLDIAVNDPHLLGASFSLWGDFLGQGYTIYDAYARVKPAMYTVGEKTWAGKSGDIYSNFINIASQTGDAPGTALDGFPVSPGSIKLGNSTTAPNIDTRDSNNLNAIKVITGSMGGTAVSISAYIGAVDTAPFNQYQLGVYTDNGGKPGSLIAQTAIGTLTPNAWNTLPISAVLNANTSYWLTYHSNGRSYGVNDMYNINGGTSAYAAAPFSSLPTNFGSATIEPVTYTIFLTYNIKSG